MYGLLLTGLFLNLFVQLCCYSTNTWGRKGRAGLANNGKRIQRNKEIGAGNIEDWHMRAGKRERERERKERETHK